jgi:hypothetical protein
MEKLIQMLQEKAELDEATSKKVAEFIKTHMADIPVWLGSDGASKLFGEVSSFFGSLAGDKKTEPTEPPPVQPKD